MKDEKNEYEEQLERKALEGAATEIVGRYGSAVKEHYVAYSGVDNENNITYKRSLKKINQYKSDPNNKGVSDRQQAGFSAEVKSTARKNAKNIIEKNPNRTVRTDDAGSVNDELYDMLVKDSKGNIIKGSGSQMKFVGATPEDLLNKMNSKKFQKYLDADAWIDIADDDYDALMGKNGQPGIIDNKIEQLKKKMESAKRSGNAEQAKKYKEQMDKYSKIKSKLRKAGLTRKEALFAKKHPKLSTANDVVKIAHKSGVEQAKTGAVISGSISLIKNIVACTKGEKEAEDAAKDVVLDTGKGAAISYTTAFTGSVIKGAMQNSKSTVIKAASKTNLPASLVSTTVNVGKTLRRYIKGEISGSECVENLGEQGVGEIGAAMYSTIAVASVAGAKNFLLTTVAGVAGSTFGYAAAVAVYKELSTALKEYELAKEERIRIEQEVEESVKMILQYREEMEQAVSLYMQEHLSVFEEGFAVMDESILNNDIDGFIRGNSIIQGFLGKKMQYSNQKEFDDFMMSDLSLKF